MQDETKRFWMRPSVGPMTDGAITRGGWWLRDGPPADRDPGETWIGDDEMAHTSALGFKLLMSLRSDFVTGRVSPATPEEVAARLTIPGDRVSVAHARRAVAELIASGVVRPPSGWPS